MINSWDIFSVIANKTKSTKNEIYFNLVLENKHKMFYIENKCIVFLFPKENNLAYFGLWETINDIDSNKKIFQQMFDWAKKNSIIKILGPIDGNLYFKSHLCLTRKEPIFSLETDNPTYMQNILTNICKATIINTKQSGLIKNLQLIKNNSYEVIPFDTKYFTSQALSNLQVGYVYSHFGKSEKDITRCLKYMNLVKSEIYSVMVVQNNILLGYCIVNINKKSIGGKILAVHQDFRSQGIAGILINHILKFKNYKIYSLQVNTNNKKVIKLANKLSNVEYTKKYNLYNINNK